ncbi:MAG: sigma-70 family RNA polymerase sigma factor [Opitutaceae bacterium]|nr:sigma-70 family RNA polymerase sigma factor [Opitutaceae bacterium]
MNDDSDLLRDYLESGSQAAFTRLVERHINAVYATALRRSQGDVHRAKEITQMVFIDAARKARQLARHPALAAWLHSSTRWAASNLRRAEQRRSAREASAAAEGGTFSEGGASVVVPEIYPLLDEALDDLRDADRAAIVQRYFEDRSFSDIARQIGLSENAARMRVERALSRLQGILRRRGVGVSAGSLGLSIAQNARAAAPTELVASVSQGAAVAGATMTGVTAWMASFFMNKLATSAAVAAGLTLAVTAVQWRSYAAARSQLARQSSERENQETRLGSSVSTGTRVSPVAPPRSPMQAGAGNEDPFAAERQRGDAFLAAHPDVHAALVGAELARIRGTYGPLFRELGLSASQIAAVESLLLGSQGKHVPGVGLLHAGEFMTKSEREAALLPLIGERGLARMRETARIGGGEPMTQSLASRAASLGDALRPEQAVLVQDALRDALKDRDGAAVWGRVESRLRGVLSSLQMRELQDVVALEVLRRAQELGKGGVLP